MTGHTTEALQDLSGLVVPRPPAAPHSPSAESVQEHLGRVLASKSFARSKDLCRFLRFVVEQTLRNRTVRLKEYLIGVTVFERGEGFNPGTDPIVRVQARRLRSKLDQYYETEGWKDTVRIELPSGRYVPVFHHRRLPVSNRTMPIEGGAPPASPSAEAVSAIREEIAQAVADVLRAHLSNVPEPLADAAWTAPNEAHDLCHKGHLYLDQPTPEAVRLSLECFERALQADPSHGPAHAGMAVVYAVAGVSGVYPLNAAMARVKSLAAKALDLDARSAEAHTALAVALAAHDWDFPAAEREFLRALNLAPGLAPAHHWYAVAGLLPLGQLDRAILEIKVALAFAPVSASIETDLAWALCQDRRYEEALEHCRKSIEAAPTSVRAHWVLGLIYECQSKLESAFAAYDRAARLGGAAPPPSVLAAQGYICALAGRRDEAARRLADLTDRARPGGTALAAATVYLGLGDRDRTFESLQRALHERDGGLIWVQTDPRFEPLRGDPRFQKLLTEMRPISELVECS